MMSESFLVTNKHLQLQLVLIQFLSAALADDGSNVSVEMVDNSTQAALRNQIAGKQHCNRNRTFSAQSRQSCKLQCENFHSIIGSRLFPRN